MHKFASLPVRYSTFPTNKLLSFGPPFTPKPLFQGGSQSKKSLLNVGMKC